MDLLYEYSPKLLTTDFVKKEVSAKSKLQKERFKHAVRTSRIEVETLSSPLEMDLFTKLSSDERLGVGESSAVALASERDISVAMDDKRAIEITKIIAPLVKVITTKDIVVGAIQNGYLTVQEADTIKLDWAENHRFRLNVESFESLIR